ncbi:hypothetical protein [Desulfovibrio sp. QI0434]
MIQNKKSNKFYIGAVINFALDMEELSDDEIINELKKNNIDVDTAIPKILLDVQKTIYNKTWTDIAYENKSTMSSISKNISETLSSGKENILAAIKDLLLSGEFQVQHRDYKDLTEDDLLSLLEDAEFLRKLDESKRKS